MKRNLLHNNRISLLGILALLSFLILFLSRNAFAQEDTTLAPEKLTFWDKIQGPATNDIETMFVDNNTGRIYAGTSGNGVLVSTNSGQSWTSANTGLTNMYITCIESDGPAVYAGTWGGGIFRTVNQGGLWTEVNTGLDAKFIRSIKAGNNMVFAGTYGQGVYKSSDKGDKWTAINSHLWHMDVTALIINKDGQLIAGTSGGGIFKTSDNGQTWVRANGSLTNRYVTSFVMNKIGEIYAGTYGGGVNFSVNGGASWSEYKDDSPKNVTSLTFYTDDQPVAGTNDKGIYKYDNVYEQWRHTEMPINGIHALARNNAGVLYASIPKEGLYKSTDGGMKWVRIYNNDEVGITSIASFKNGLMAGTSSKGGVYLSTDYGTTWNAAGLTGVKVNAIGFDSTGVIYAGTPTGLYQSVDKGVTWMLFGKMDSVVRSFAVNANGHFFVGAMGTVRSTDYGTTWVDLGMITHSNSGITCLAISPKGSVFVKSDTGLICSTDNGSSWRVVIPRDNPVVSVTFDKSGNVFAATDDGLYRSTNNGTSWTHFNFGLASHQISYAAITPRDDWYVALRWEDGVLHSSNRGATWDTVALGYDYSVTRSFIMSSDRYLYIGSTSLYRAVESYDLAAPKLRSPSDLVLAVSRNPMLNWEQVPRADLYEVQVSTDVDFKTISEDIVLAGTSYNVQRTLDYNTFYNWRVRAKTNGSLGDWSKPYHFTTLVAPPILISPVNNTGGYPASIKFTWHKVDGAGAYNIQVSKDNGFSNFTVNKEAVDTTFTFSPFDLNTKYYWRVQGKVQGGTGDWSEVWNFTTKLKQVKLRKPADGSYGLPIATVFEWFPVDSAAGYYIQVAGDKNFTNMVYDGKTDSDSMHTLAQSEYFTTYFWRVKAYNSLGESDWSAVWSYTTVIKPAELISPADSSYENPLALDLKWNSYNKATSYHVQVATDPEFKTKVFEDSTLTTFTFSISPLQDYTTYYWHVRFKVNNYIGLWSETWQFTTAIGRPVLSLPATGIKDQWPYPVELQWQTLRGAELYRLQLAKDTGFTNIVYDYDSLKTNSYQLPLLEYSTLYYWRVMGKNNHVQSQWSDTWNFETKIKSSVNESTDADNVLVSVYPNPFRSSVNIKLNLPLMEKAKLAIYDQKGSLVQEFNLNPYGQQEINWQTGTLATGDYVLYVETASRRIVKRIVCVK